MSSTKKDMVKVNIEATNGSKGEDFDVESTNEGKVSEVNNKKLLRKLDCYLLPGITLLYLLSFIDRGNIGNARIEGLDKDLHLVGNQFNIALTVFYFTYSPFEIPSNYLMTRIRPSIFLPSMMVAWGIVITLTGIVTSYGGLLACRIMLGVTEAGLFPGVAFYLTKWYARDELQFRQALFYGAASLAGAFSGLLAYGISFLDGVGGKRGWQYIFLLEGGFTIFVALTSFFYIFDYPDTAKFLSEEERFFLQNKLSSSSYMTDAIDISPDEEVIAKKSSRSAIFDAFKDWQCYIHILIHWSVVTTIYALSVFLPTIIKQMGYTSAQAQLMSVPPYIVACIATIVVAKFSDKYKVRSPFLMTAHVFMMLGYLMAVNTDVKEKPGVVYAGIFVTVISAFCAFPCMISWLANNLEGSEKRSAGMALQIGVGNMAGAMCVNFFRTQDAPNYKIGYSIELMFVAIGCIASAGVNVIYYYLNKKKDRELAEGKYAAYSYHQLEAMGDRNPYFKYLH
ncbi:hypothetical protein G9P44_005784 [Scheffersomyces stipitis]|nr:hypothetical protein G9P44_005784 [Scheffersomyces stipitis]